MKKNLLGKNILITAGPTWTAIDKVRVLSNIASGRTGTEIAEYACKMGAKVTLLLGPAQILLDKKIAKNIRVLNFRYFDELFDLVKKEVRSGEYDIFIHSAAVSDYKPCKTFRGKIKSNQKLTIKLKPAEKIIDCIKKIDPAIFLVKFKLEVNKPDAQLIKTAYKSMKQSRADLVVANTPDIAKQKTFIINPSKQITEVPQRKKLPEYLFKAISRNL
ncbi:MAG: phosphopantothenoylcysteine decarboxylase [bacterium]